MALDHEVGPIRDRDLSALDFPYVFLGGTYCPARVNHRGVFQALMVDFDMAADEHQEVLGFDVGDSESSESWTAFLRSLESHGLDGAKLAISDAHSALKTATGTVFRAASWQRCPVHWMRNLLSIVLKRSQEMVVSIIHTAFAKSDAEHVRKQFDEVTTMLAKSDAEVAEILEDARDDVLAFA